MRLRDDNYTHNRQGNSVEVTQDRDRIPREISPFRAKYISLYDVYGERANYNIPKRCEYIIRWSTLLQLQMIVKLSSLHLNLTKDMNSKQDMSLTESSIVQMLHIVDHHS